MIGVDVGKASLSVCAWDGEAQRVRWELEVANTEEGVRGGPQPSQGRMGAGAIGSGLPPQPRLCAPTT